MNRDSKWYHHQIIWLFSNIHYATYNSIALRCTVHVFSTLYMCSSISVMYCGLKGLSIFQSQLLQTIISCCSELISQLTAIIITIIHFSHSLTAVFSHTWLEREKCFVYVLKDFWWKISLKDQDTNINYKQLILTSS